MRRTLARCLVRALRSCRDQPCSRSTDRALRPHPGLASPPGFSETVGSAIAPTAAEGTALRARETALVQQKQAGAWAVAKSPGQQLPIACFMMFMAGNGVQVFSIMVTATNIASPLRAILGSGEQFARFADPGVDTLTPRLVYCGLFLFQMLFALRKLNQMGLLPTHASDWAPSDPPVEPLERSYMVLPLS